MQGGLERLLAGVVRQDGGGVGGFGVPRGGAGVAGGGVPSGCDRRRAEDPAMRSPSGGGEQRSREKEMGGDEKQAKTGIPSPYP
nr:unnamed protein product [Digitaria exilis]